MRYFTSVHEIFPYQSLWNISWDVSRASMRWALLWASVNLWSISWALLVGVHETSHKTFISSLMKHIMDVLRGRPWNAFVHGRSRTFMGVQDRSWYVSLTPTKKPVSTVSVLTPGLPATERTWVFTLVIKAYFGYLHTVIFRRENSPLNLTVYIFGRLDCRLEIWRTDWLAGWLTGLYKKEQSCVYTTVSITVGTAVSYVSVVFYLPGEVIFPSLFYPDRLCTTCNNPTHNIIDLHGLNCKKARTHKREGGTQDPNRRGREKNRSYQL